MTFRCSDENLSQGVKQNNIRKQWNNIFNNNWVGQLFYQGNKSLFEGMTRSGEQTQEQTDSNNNNQYEAQLIKIHNLEKELQNLIEAYDLSYSDYIQMYEKSKGTYLNKIIKEINLDDGGEKYYEINNFGYKRVFNDWETADVSCKQKQVITLNRSELEKEGHNNDMLRELDTMMTYNFIRSGSDHKDGQCGLEGKNVNFKDDPGKRGYITKSGDLKIYPGVSGEYLYLEGKGENKGNCPTRGSQHIDVSSSSSFTSLDPTPMTKAANSRCEEHINVDTYRDTVLFPKQEEINAKSKELLQAIDGLDEVIKTENPQLMKTKEDIRGRLNKIHRMNKEMDALYKDKDTTEGIFDFNSTKLTYQKMKLVVWIVLLLIGFGYLAVMYVKNRASMGGGIMPGDVAGVVPGAVPTAVPGAT